MTIYGYARAGPDGQTLDAQASALIAAGAEHVFREPASGARTGRRELAGALDALGAGDALFVTRLDRLARSTRDLLNILDAVAKAGASFRSLGEAWADAMPPHGGLVLTAFSGLAEFEREIIRARTREGRERAKARGVPMGRPSKLTAREKRDALKALAEGAATQADLARRFKISQSTISRLAHEVDPRSAAAGPALDAETERAARVFMRRVEDKYPAIEGLVFGSRARGDHRPDSDADIAVILKGEPGDRWEITRELSGIAFDVMLETAILVQALPLWESELTEPGRFSNPALIENIKRDGLRI